MRRVGIRPEHIEIVPKGQGITAVVQLRETLGGDSFLYTRLQTGDQIVVRAPGDTSIDAGDEIGLRFPASRLYYFDSNGLALQ